MTTKPGGRPDPTDLKLLELLQRDSLATADRLAEKVPLSPSAITRRVRRLRAEGWIERDAAIVSRTLSDARLRALVFVQVHEHAEERGIAALRERLIATDEVQMLVDIAGAHDLCLLVSTRDMTDYNDWTARWLERDPAVRRFETSFVKRVRKQSGFVPLS